MNILIADFDIYSSVGGGQTFYRKIFEKYPEIQFAYLLQGEARDRFRPANVRGIPYQQRFLLADFKNYLDVSPPRWSYRSFVIASNIAASVEGQRFDLVEIPDYQQWGIFLRPALQQFQVSFDKLVLSLHGKISTTIRLDWFSQGQANISLDLEEKMQYRTADLRYGISRSYLDEWCDLVPIAGYYFNPLHFIELPQPLSPERREGPPDLTFIGRTEKRKGPDIFVELAWWLPRSLYREARTIGAASLGEDGTSSDTLIRGLIRRRLPDIQQLPALPREQLFQEFARRSLTLIPSRYDTLNLVALESLFAGCPTAIGGGAGACRFLEETFPKIPFIKIDTHDLQGNLPLLTDVLKNYDRYRERLSQALLDLDTQTSDPTLPEIYLAEPAFDGDVRSQLAAWYEQLTAYWNRQVSASPARARGIRLLNRHAKPILKQGYQKARQRISQWLAETPNRQLVRSPFLYGNYQSIFNQAEATANDIEDKLIKCWNLSELLDADRKGIRGKLMGGYRIDRARCWRQIARLEQLRGNDAIAATYYLRVMRLLGGDRFGELPYVLKTLHSEGLDREAAATEAIYGRASEAERQQTCCEFLEKAYCHNQQPQQWEYEIFDDRRSQPTYRASIVASLYNAAAKLPRFLRTLRHQTLLRSKSAEIILVDSGSPTDEYAVFQSLADELQLPILYVRSQQRETIQSAWNRGISLARSPYLSFLGVDETIVSDCLEVLVDFLDREPDIDWAIGHSLVTQVDRDGNWQDDIMLYDRRGYRQDLVYLETCYLSWVGALYRRSIHDRFGYYDASFRGAGDTEFKNRILPHIQSAVIDRTLGLFWNYPDERTTQSPRVELEDMRAWYLHRTVGGIHYALGDRSQEEAEQLLYASLSYRKSYCQHASSDLDYAYNLCQFIQQRYPNSPALHYFDGIRQLLAAYRSLDWIDPLTRFSPLSTLRQTRQLAHKIAAEHRKLGRGIPNFQPDYQIFHDNRHEQHAFLWLTELTAY